MTALLLSLLAVACGDPKDDTATAEDPATHACEQAGNAGTAITAGATREEDASAVLEVGEDPFTVTLVDGATGWVRLDVPEPASLLLFAGTADVVMDLTHEDTAEGLPTPAPVEGCPDEVPEHFDLDLHEAGTWHLALGPAVVDTVWLLLLDAAGHAHGE